MSDITACKRCGQPAAYGCCSWMDSVPIPTKEEADAILREHGLNPEEVGKRFSDQVKQLLEMMK